MSEPVKDETAQTAGGYWVVSLLEKGNHELSEGARDELVFEDFAEWLQEQRGNSIMGNYLDEEKQTWASERVLKNRV